MSRFGAENLFDSQRGDKGHEDAESLPYWRRILRQPPRSDYMYGRSKLKFEHWLSTGEILKAAEDRNGVAHISIEKGGKEIVDFSKLIPPEYRFITPTFMMNNNLNEGEYSWRRGHWSTSGENYISIGDMRDLRSVWSLLHEIGHAKRGPKLHERSDVAVSRVKMIKSRTKRLERFKNRDAVYMAEYVASSERDAWAEAVKIARKIYEETGVNLFEAFGDLNDFESFIHGNLELYAKEYSRESLITKEGAEKIWDNFKKQLSGRKDEIDYISKLFHGGKFEEHR